MLESRSQKQSRSSRWIWRKKRTETDEMEQVQSKLLEMSITTTTMNDYYIPNDVMIQILSRLPGKSLLKFRWACKNWFDLIKDPSFAKLQFVNHSINNPLLMLSSYTDSCSLVLSSLNCTNLVEDDDHSDDEGSSSSRSLLPTITGLFKCHSNSSEPTVVGSCNGLLCIRKRICDDAMHHKVTFCIWNPCTNEFKDSSVEPIINRDCNINNIYGFSYGFGYDQTIDDYKVIRNTMFWVHDHYVTEVQVYTLGTNSWKRIGNHYPFRLSSMTDFVRNGAFYFLGRKSSLGSVSYTILCFDIAKEEYREISKPWFVNDLSDVQLIQLNGCLCIAQDASTQSPGLEVWMVKDYCHNNMNNNEYSWTKLCTIRQPIIIKCCLSTGVQPIGIINENGGEILIRLLPKQDLVWYNEKDDNLREIGSLKVQNVKMVYTYVENLVSLNSGTYMGHEEEEEEQAE